MPHDGRLSNFRLDLVAVPLKIRRLYRSVVEGAAGEDYWGRITPREIEATLEEVLGGPGEDPGRERRDLHRAVIEALRSSEGDFRGDELLAVLTEIVEESYYSARLYDESAFRLARAIALRFRALAAGSGAKEGAAEGAAEGARTATGEGEGGA